MSVYLSELSKKHPQVKVRKTRFWLHVLILGIAGAYLRAWSMMNESPDFSEIMAALIALVPYGEYIGRAQPDFCPPLFYFFSHPVAKATLSLSSLRVISIVAGALTPVALYMAGRRLYGETAGLIAAYLLLLNPLHIYYSQEFQPAALFALLAIVGFIAMVRSAESNSWRDWLFYDVMAVALLHTQREAVFFVVCFPLIQICKVMFFPPVQSERRMRRFRLLQGILLNHFIIIAVSVPWLWIMPNKVPWELPVPQASDMARVFGQYIMFGLTGWSIIAPWIICVILALVLLPPALKLVGRLDFRTFAALALLLLTLVLPFVYSQFETPRFIPQREGFTALPWFCMALGILLARCNWLIKTSLMTAFSVVFLLASIRQARTLEKTATTDMLNVLVREGATANDVVAFWPGYTTALGDFWKKFYDRPFTTVSAGELLQSWANLPTERPVYFVVSQFPTDSAHLYTFQGALAHYADSKILWQNNLNMLIRAENLNQKVLAQWYDEPKSLKILDQPTSETQFIFTAADPIFRPESDKDKADWPFASDRLDLTYDATGHRFVWTTRPTVTLNLKVMLAPGKYLLKLHCSPDFDQPEYGRHKERNVQVTLRSGEDQRRVNLSSAQTITLLFSTDVELHSLPVTISVDQMHDVPPPGGGSFGLKIYSLRIDEALSDT